MTGILNFVHGKTDTSSITSTTPATVAKVNVDTPRANFENGTGVTITNKTITNVKPGTYTNNGTIGTLTIPSGAGSVDFKNEGTTGNVDVQSDQPVNLSGTKEITKVTVSKPNAKLNINKESTVSEIDVTADAKDSEITNEGTVTKLDSKATGSKVTNNAGATITTIDAKENMSLENNGSVDTVATTSGKEVDVAGAGKVDSVTGTGTITGENKAVIEATQAVTAAETAETVETIATARESLKKVNDDQVKSRLEARLVAVEEKIALTAVNNMTANWETAESIIRNEVLGLEYTMFDELDENTGQIGGAKLAVIKDIIANKPEANGYEDVTELKSIFDLVVTNRMAYQNARDYVNTIGDDTLEIKSVVTDVINTLSRDGNVDIQEKILGSNKIEDILLSMNNTLNAYEALNVENKQLVLDEIAEETNYKAYNEILSVFGRKVNELKLTEAAEVAVDALGTEKVMKSDFDAAKKLVDALEASDIKTGLLARLDNLLAETAPEGSLTTLELAGLTTENIHLMVLAMKNVASTPTEVEDFLGTVGITFESANITVEDGVLTVKKGVLTTDTWDNHIKDKEDAILSEPYRITVLIGKDEKVAKIAFYRDGTVAIEEIN